MTGFVGFLSARNGEEAVERDLLRKTGWKVKLIGLGSAGQRILVGPPGLGSRTTRFHTGRGSLMPLPAWRWLPRLLWHRWRGEYLRYPLMVPQAVSYLDRIARPDWHGLELGSGNSTCWYAERLGTLLSFEHDPAWYRRIVRQLEQTGHSNSTIRLVPPNVLLKTLRQLPDDAFDLVVVDFKEFEISRLTAIVELKRKVRCGGYLVLDDSDRPRYRDVDQILPAWSVRRFVGLRASPFVATETSVFRRPLKADSE